MLLFNVYNIVNTEALFCQQKLYFFHSYPTQKSLLPHQLCGIFGYSILYYFEQCNIVQELCSKSLYYYHIYPLFRPVTDNIEKMAKIQLCYVGFSQKNGMEIVHIYGGSFYQCVFESGNYY